MKAIAHRKPRSASVSTYRNVLYGVNVVLLASMVVVMEWQRQSYKSVTERTERYHLMTVTGATAVEGEMHIVEDVLVAHALETGSPEAVARSEPFLTAYPDARQALYLAEAELDKIVETQNVFHSRVFDELVPRTEQQFFDLKVIISGGLYQRSEAETAQRQLTGLALSLEQLNRLHRSEYAELTKALPMQNRRRLQTLIAIAVGLLAISYAVTRRIVKSNERATDALQESEARYRTVVQTAADGVITVNSGGNIISWNTAAENTFGYSAEEAIGAPWTSLLPERYREADQKVFEQVVATEESELFKRTFEFIGLKKGNVEFPLELSAAHWKAGGETFLTGFVRDITVRKRAEALIHGIHVAATRYMRSASVHDLFKQLLDTLVSLTDSEYGFIGEVFLDETGQPFLTTRVITNAAWDEETQALHDRVEHEGMEFHKLNTLFGAVMATGKPVIANDPSNDARRGGTPRGHPPFRSFLGIPFGPDERMAGMVGIANRPGGYDEAMIEYLQPLIDQCESALAAHRSKEQRKRLEREILEISAREQRQIGQDLHDGLGQHLTGIAFLNKALAQKLAGQSRPEAVDAAEIGRLVNATITQVRNLGKGLHPTALVTGGLPVALEELASTTEQVFDLSCVLTADRAASLPDDVTTQLYHVAREAVTNAVKHGEASNITLELHTAGNTTTLTVEDDGRGFPADGNGAQGMGLHIMRYRARMIDGSFDIRRRPSGGTVVLCSFPTPPLKKGKATKDEKRQGAGAARG